MQDVLEKFLTASVLFMPRVFGSLAILAAFWIASIVLQALVVKIGTARRFHAEVVTILRQLVKGAALAFGVVTALGTSGSTCLRSLPASASQVSCSALR